METYSSSKLKTFESCPLQYKCKYIDKIDCPPIVSYDTNFGSLIHKMAEIYNGSNKNDLIPLTKEFPLDKEYKSFVLPTINNFFAFFDRYKHLEYETEKSYEYKNDIYWINGIIDRIMMRDKDIVIVDYKTAAHANRSRFEFQLMLYNLMISKILEIEPKDIKLMLFFPRPNVEEKFVFSNQTIKLFEQQIISKIKTIEDTKRWNASPGFHCKWCIYKAYCPIYKTRSK